MRTLEGRDCRKIRRDFWPRQDSKTGIGYCQLIYGFGVMVMSKSGRNTLEMKTAQTKIPMATQKWRSRFRSLFSSLSTPSAILSIWTCMRLRPCNIQVVSCGGEGVDDFGGVDETPALFSPVFSLSFRSTSIFVQLQPFPEVLRGKAKIV